MKPATDKTENAAELVIANKQLVFPNKKNIRDQSIEELLKNILPYGNMALSELEQTLLKEVLINNKTFKELNKFFGISVIRQEQIFANALIHLNRTLRTISEKLNTHAYTILEKELAETKKKLELFEISVENHDKLLPKIKKILTTHPY